MREKSIPIYSNLFQSINKNHCQPTATTIDRPRPRTLCLPPTWGTVPSLKLISRCVYVPFSSLPSLSFSFFPFRLFPLSRSPLFSTLFLVLPLFYSFSVYSPSYIHPIVYALLFTQFSTIFSFSPSFWKIFSPFFSTPFF